MLMKTILLLGTYAMAQNLTISCPDNTYSNSTVCLPCPANSFSVGGFKNDKITIGCLACPLGTSSNPGMPCGPCPAGLTLSGGTCNNCAANSAPDATGKCVCLTGYSNDPLNGDCVACSPGLYKDTMVGACLACPLGTSSNSSAATSATTCLPCAPGHYADVTGLGGCLSCPQGTFTNANGSTSISACQACPSGSISHEDTSQCTLCGDGFYSVNNTCLACDGTLGFYSNSSTIGCALCPAGTTPLKNSVGFFGSCGACPANQYSNAQTGFQCTSCQLTNNITQGQIGCDGNCPLGYYAFDNGTCSPCPFGTLNVIGGGCACQNPNTYWNATYTPDQPPSFACPLCLASLNQFSNPNSIKCSTCQPGQFWNSSCQFCPAGSFSVNASAGCSQCLPGTFTPFSGATACLPCPLGTYSNVAGSIQCIPAQTGSYVSPMNPTTSIPCDLNSYSGPAASACSACNKTSTLGNDAVGSFSCKCQPGFVHFDLVSGGCVPCRDGSFAGLGDLFCTNVTKGQFVKPSDRSKPLSCGKFDQVNGNVFDGYSASDLAISCMPCDTKVSTLGPNADVKATYCNCQPGYFGFDPLGGTCNQCQIGYVSNGGNASTCFPCPSGTYQTDAKTCTACPLGSFSATPSNQCSPTSGDGFVYKTGSSHPYVCDAVSTIIHPNSTNNTGCDCKVGFSNFQINETSSAGYCSACPTNSFSLGNQSSCSVCPDGTYASSLDRSQCFPCPSGAKYCADGTIENPSVGAADCGCLAGFNAWTKDTGSCVACDNGWYSKGGRSVCSFCGSGKYLLGNDCLNCPPIGTIGGPPSCPGYIAAALTTSTTASITTTVSTPTSTSTGTSTTTTVAPVVMTTQVVSVLDPVSAFIGTITSAVTPDSTTTSIASTSTSSTSTSIQSTTDNSTSFIVQSTTSSATTVPTTTLPSIDQVLAAGPAANRVLVSPVVIAMTEILVDGTVVPNPPTDIIVIPQPTTPVTTPAPNVIQVGGQTVTIQAPNAGPSFVSLTSGQVLQVVGSNAGPGAAANSGDVYSPVTIGTALLVLLTNLVLAL